LSSGRDINLDKLFNFVRKKNKLDKIHPKFFGKRAKMLAGNSFIFVFDGEKRPSISAFFLAEEKLVPKNNANCRESRENLKLL